MRSRLVKQLRLLALALLLGMMAAVNEAPAEGFLGRFRKAVRVPAAPVDSYPTQIYSVPMRTYPTRNLNQGRTRLPSGRTYYRGRYYGNFNNRFYGPQYGYF